MPLRLSKGQVVLESGSLWIGVWRPFPHYLAAMNYPESKDSSGCRAWEAATNSHAAGQAAGQPSIMQQGLGFSLQGWAGPGDSLQLPTRDQLLLAFSDLAPLLILLIFPKLRPPAARLWTGLTNHPFEAVALAPFSR